MMAHGLVLPVPQLAARYVIYIYLFSSFENLSVIYLYHHTANRQKVIISLGRSDTKFYYQFG